MNVEIGTEAREIPFLGIHAPCEALASRLIPTPSNDDLQRQCPTTIVIASRGGPNIDIRGLLEDHLPPIELFSSTQSLPSSQNIFFSVKYTFIT